MTDTDNLDDRIIRAAIKGLLDAGFRLSVFDGEETTVSKSTDAAAVFAALRTTDEDQIRVHSPMGQYWGFVYLVYGNSPGEVICDHTSGLEPYLTIATALAEIDPARLDAVKAMGGLSDEEAVNWIITEGVSNGDGPLNIDDDACDNSTGQHTWREPLDERAPIRCISCNAEKVA